MRVPSKLLAFAEEHYGLVTIDEAQRAGMSASSWYRAVASGVFVSVFPNVARLPGSPVTRYQTIAAAVLAAGPGAVASHRSAAFLWDVPRPEHDPIDVTLPKRRRGPNLPGVVIHQPLDQVDLGRILRHGIPTTNILRLVCDIGAVDASAVSATVGHFVVRGWLPPAAIDRALRQHARKGRSGITALRAAAAQWIIDGKPADSLLEPAMNQLLAAYHLPHAVFHAVICDEEVDFWFEGTPVVLECDGWEFHASTRRQHERDTERRTKLLAAGYITVPFTFRGIMRKPWITARRVRETLDRWAPPA